MYFFHTNQVIRQFPSQMLIWGFSNVVALLLFLRERYGVLEAYLRWFFVWCATHGRIITLYNLNLSRQVIANWCACTKNEEKSVPPLLIHCQLARELAPIIS